MLWELFLGNLTFSAHITNKRTILGMIWHPLMYSERVLCLKHAMTLIALIFRRTPALREVRTIRTLQRIVRLVGLRWTREVVVGKSPVVVVVVVVPLVRPCIVRESPSVCRRWMVIGPRLLGQPHVWGWRHHLRLVLETEQFGGSQ